MHVERGVLDEPLDPFDDDEPREPVSVERVEEEEPRRSEHSGCLGDNAARVFDVFEKVHRADDVERAVSVWQRKRIAVVVPNGARCVVTGGYLERFPRRVEARHPVSQARKVI